jgi:HEAT repeat protein
MSDGVLVAERQPLPKLSSLLVQRGVPARALEEALARQGAHGGDLATNLLEVGGTREEVLVPVLAESSDLEPAPMGRLPMPPAAVLRLVPGELALRHGIFPLALAGRVLTIATAETLSAAVEGDLGFALAVDIRQKVALLARIRQAIADAYHAPLERRFARIVARLEGRLDPSPSIVPPRANADDDRSSAHSIATPPPRTEVPKTLAAGAAPAPRASPPAYARQSSMPDANVARPAPPAAVEVESPPRARKANGPEPVTAPPQPRASSPGESDLKTTLISRISAEALEALYAEDPSALPPQDAEDTLVNEGSVAPPKGAISPARKPTSDDDLPETVSAPPGWPEAAPEAPARRGDRPRREGPRSRPLTGALRRAVLDERKARGVSPGRKHLGRPRRKGPFTAAMAEEEFGNATSTDLVLDILFAFAQQFFEYTAILVVHGDLAGGRDASGPGAGPARVITLAFPLDQPSSLATARDRRAPLVTTLGDEGIDAELASELERNGRGEGDASPAVVILPIVVRHRVVALLYGDDGATDVELSAIGEVLAVAALSAKALERVILRRKLGTQGTEEAAAKLPSLPAPAAARPPTPEGNAGRQQTRAAAMAALARLVEVPGAPAPTTPPRTPSAAPPAASPAASPATPAAPAPLPTVPSAAARTLPSGSTTARPLRPREAGEGIEKALAHAVAPEGAAVVEPPPAPAVAQADLDAIDAAWEDPPASRRNGPASRRRRAPLGVVAGGPRSRATSGSPASQRGVEPPATMGPAAQIRTAPMPTPARSTQPHRRAVAPSFGARSKASQGLGAQPLPPAPPPNATAAPVRVPPPRARAKTDPPETLPGPPLGNTGAAPPAAPPPPLSAAFVPSGRPASSEFGAGSTLPGTRVRTTPDVPVLVQRWLEGGPASAEAFRDLVRLGESAMQAVMARFPGPLTFDRQRARGNLPLASRCGPLLELIAAIGRSAVPFLSVRSTAGDPDVRFWATHLLGELGFPEAAQSVAVRLFDEDPAVRRIARRSAAALLATGPAAEAPILPMLERLARSGNERASRRLLALEALAELCLPSTVPVLIAVLSDPAPEVAEAAHRALVHITRQDHRRDARRWVDWLTGNATRHRVEWLIDALVHEQPTIRRAAAEELQHIAVGDFGYFDDLPPDERKAAQARYRAWWNEEGRALLKKR